jgi:hypothetical protein
MEVAFALKLDGWVLIDALEALGIKPIIGGISNCVL